jgi:lysine 2,3-aminomutase
LVALLENYRPLRLAIHLNHPRELAGPVRTALAACRRARVRVLVQTVLLRGINDDPDTLEALFRECLTLKLSPYYLFQLDLAPGTAHFRVPLKQGLALYRDLQTRFRRARLPPDALPAYAVDLPGGGGKIRLGEDSIAGERMEPAGRAYLLRGPGGRLWPYPADE